MAVAGPGDFIYVPPFVPHQELNANPDSELSCVVVRSGQEPVVVNLELPDKASSTWTKERRAPARRARCTFAVGAASAVAYDGWTASAVRIVR